MPFVVGADAPPPILPVLKITASSDHFRQRSNRIDFDAGRVLAGKEPPDLAAARLLRRVVAVASGAVTRTEQGHNYLLSIPVSHHQA